MLHQSGSGRARRRLGAKAQQLGRRLGAGRLERRRDEREARRGGHPLESRVGVEPDLRAHLVERLGDREREALQVDARRDADADRRHARRLGDEAGGEVGDVEEDHVRLPALDDRADVRVGEARVDADEEIAGHERVGVVGGERPRLFEDRRSRLVRRVGDRVMVEPGVGDHRPRRGGRGHDDVVVAAEEGVGEGNHGADVAGPGTGADQYAHKGARRARAPDYSRARARWRVWSATATATPTASISTSTGVPWRPSTKVWWSSSVAA